MLSTPRVVHSLNCNSSKVWERKFSQTLARSKWNYILLNPPVLNFHKCSLTSTTFPGPKTLRGRDFSCSCLQKGPTGTIPDGCNINKPLGSCKAVRRLFKSAIKIWNLIIQALHPCTGKIPSMGRVKHRSHARTATISLFFTKLNSVEDLQVQDTKQCHRLT